MCFDGFNRHPLIIESIFCTHTHKRAQTFFTILFSYKFIFSYFFDFEEWETKNDWLIDWVRTKRQKKLSLKWGEQGCSTPGCFGLCCKVDCSKYTLVGHNTSQSQLMVNLKYFLKEINRLDGNFWLSFWTFAWLGQFGDADGILHTPYPTCCQT
jgi:hypothetical protein